MCKGIEKKSNYPRVDSRASFPVVQFINTWPQFDVGKKNNFQCCVLIQERCKLKKDLLFVNDRCITGHNKMIQQT